MQQLLLEAVAELGSLCGSFSLFCCFLGSKCIHGFGVVLPLYTCNVLSYPLRGMTAMTNWKHCRAMMMTAATGAGAADADTEADAAFSSCSSCSAAAFILAAHAATLLAAEAATLACCTVECALFATHIGLNGFWAPVAEAVCRSRLLTL